MNSRPIGREADLAALDRFLVAAEQGPVALVLEGPSGIGKSTLWTATVDEARLRGFLVLSARPTGAEATWAYQALADLLAALPTDAAAALPPPQRRAIEIALLRREAAPSAPDSADPQAIAAGTTSLIRAMAGRHPVLVAVDDVAWSDLATMTILEAVVRRLAGTRVGVLLTQRVEEPGPAPFDIDRSIATERRWVGPLTIGALHLLLADRLGSTLPRPTLIRLHAASQGNPFHALEIGRALQRLPRLPAPGEPLPVPASLRALLSARLEGTDHATRAVLLLVAAAGAIDRTELASARPAGAPEPLDAAVDAGLLVVDGGVVRFSHPLISSVVDDEAGARARRDAHATLATVVREPQARARHMALASTSPDGAVARALEEAALDARRRGAMDDAAELIRLAVDRTPEADADARGRRRLLLTELLMELPDLPAAEASAARLIEELPAGPARAEARMLAGTTAWYTQTARVAADHLLAALEEAGDDAELLGRLHYRLAIFEEADAAAARDHAARAMELLASRGPDVTLAAAMFTRFMGDVVVGDPPDLDLFERALATERAAGDQAVTDKSTIPGIWWVAIDRYDLARERFSAMLEEARLAGLVSGEADLLTRLAETEAFAGRWTEGRQLAEEALMAAQQEGQLAPEPVRRAVAILDAFEGDLARARGTAEAGLALATQAGEATLEIAWLVVLVIVAVAEGDHGRTVTLGERSAARLRSIGRVEGLRLDVTHERLEALAALGRLDEMVPLLAEYERRAAICPRPWVDAALARIRARAAFAAGRSEEALAATEPATDDRSAAWSPFDVARTLLVRGEILRSIRSRRDAGAALDAALASFDELGAADWVARTAAEIDRLGRHRPGSDDLTPTERRVAELAAAGRRNREVADALGISAKTVEAHLARVYAKLAIRSRAELGRAFRAPVDGPDGI